MLVLGIETSCDETALALVEDGRRVLVSLVHSQIEKHKSWGGVIPELASRLHLELINTLWQDLQKEAKSKFNLTVNDIDLVAVTSEPGLLGSLLVGINFAHTLSWIHTKPCLEVNHLYGHIAASFLETDLEPPFLALLASGGHSQIILLRSYNNYQILAETVDDAAGEAFDKVARLMSLEYPGGPAIDKLASTINHCRTSFPEIQDPQIINGNYYFPIPKVKNDNFSFSGIKTAVLRIKNKLGEEKFFQDRTQIARAFQNAVANIFITKLKKFSEEYSTKNIVLVGGVASNSALRLAARESFPEDEYQLYIPKPEYCTDNAAMIAITAHYKYLAGEFADLDISPSAKATW